ncbi:MAG: MaoC family dehydratase, partial [Caldilineaceae bacterium]
ATFVHPAPRTVTSGDVAFYIAATGSRFALPSSSAFAARLGHRAAPIDDVLAFHMVFGRTVPLTLNSVANLGYAECRFLRNLYPGDTITATSEVIGAKQTSSGKTGVVYIRCRSVDQSGNPVIEFVRWELMRKRDEGSPAPQSVIPELAAAVAPADLPSARLGDWRDYDYALAGSPHGWEDYKVGERIDHIDGMTLEEAEHLMITRLYQNTSKLHVNQFTAATERFGRRLVYGGHVISIARALTFNGLENAQNLLAINGGVHCAPCFAGDTVFAWSEVLAKAELSGRSDVAALRLRLVAAKERFCDDFPYKNDDGSYADGVILDLDYWVAVPRQG